MPQLPTFSHEDEKINSFVSGLLNTHDIPNRAQLILMSGVALNNTELIKYAADEDKGVINRLVPPNVMSLISEIFKQQLAPTAAIDASAS